MPSIARRSIRPPVVSSCISIRCAPRWMTWTSQPWFSRPRAASSPSRPPPMTAATLLCLAIAMMPVQSSMPRKANTPGRRVPLSSHAPSIGGMKARLPVAISRVSYSSCTPLSAVTMRAARSMCVTRAPLCRVMSVVLVPVQRVDVDLAHLLRAAQDVGQHDAVVVAVGLVAEHRDAELVRAAAGQALPRWRVRPPSRCRPPRAAASWRHRSCRPLRGRGARSPASGTPRFPRSPCPRPASRCTRPGPARAGPAWCRAAGPRPPPSGMWTAPLAPMGKERIGAPSRTSTTVTISAVLLPARK